jgi:ubiquinone/menaquinone biosynthesis C-methylase UbiE
MIYRDLLANDPEFELRNGVYCSTSCVDATFEHNYNRLRASEGRLYDDATVFRLPKFSGPAQLENEWKIRSQSAKKLLDFLKKKKKPRLIVEVGCGNGWLTHCLAAAVRSECCGIDVNMLELEQAARVFKQQSEVCFLNIDLTRARQTFFNADVIVVAGAIQYFPDLAEIIAKLSGYLVRGGEIHILDSPLYASPEEAGAARERSRAYFVSRNSPEMVQRYFHHPIQALHDFRYSILDGPRTGGASTRRIDRNDHSVFPWVQIEV